MNLWPERGEPLCWIDRVIVSVWVGVCFVPVVIAVAWLFGWRP